MTGSKTSFIVSPTCHSIDCALKLELYRPSNVNLVSHTHSLFETITCEKRHDYSAPTVSVGPGGLSMTVMTIVRAGAKPKRVFFALSSRTTWQRTLRLISAVPIPGSSCGQAAPSSNWHHTRALRLERWKAGTLEDFLSWRMCDG